MDLTNFKMLDKIVLIGLASDTIVTATSVPSQHAILDNHFPDFPILPGTFLLEVMAQSAGYLLMKKINFNQLAILVKSGPCKFSSMVKTNTQLRCEASVINFDQSFGLIDTRLFDGENVVSRCELRMKLIPFPSEQAKHFIMNNFEGLYLDR